MNSPVKPHPAGRSTAAANGAERPRKTLNLALQGGGSHGAFTWGVLERLLEEEALDIEGISGTSAGAMNAAVVAQGMAVGGRAEAIRLLEKFWQSVSEAAKWSPMRRSPFDVLTGNWNIDASPAAFAAHLMNGVISPYQFGFLDIDPLRDVLNAVLDTQHIRHSPIKLFISATNVTTARVRVFNHSDVSVDALLASACLPTMFKAVEIDGVPYWDGGFVANPALFPIIYGCGSPDIAVVQINPLIRLGTPTTPAEILNRMQEVSFVSSTMAEMRAINSIRQMIKEDHLKPEQVADDGRAKGRYRKMRIHRIHAEHEMQALGTVSKMNAEPDFLQYLRRLGHDTADSWLKRHFNDIGRRNTVDIRATYL